MKFKLLTDSAVPPTKGHTFDAGWDLCADEYVAIMPGTRQLIKTGIALDIPQGHAGLIWPRSGLASRYGIDVLGGVVDCGYHGEVKVVLVNHGEYTYTCKPGTRIAQIVFQPILMGGLFETERFDNDTTRGDGGFGSTGE